MHGIYVAIVQALADLRYTSPISENEMESVALHHFPIAKVVFCMTDMNRFQRKATRFLNLYCSHSLTCRLPMSIKVECMRKYTGH